MTGWLAAVGVYRDPRVLSLLFLGFSSGLPFGILAEPLTARLAESGIDKTTIGLFALVSLPYSLKFAWAPLIDRIRLPVFGAWLGRRRSWMILSQLCVLAAVGLLGLADPRQAIHLVAIMAFAVAFFSASQDIVIDAYRVEILEDRSLAAGAATATFGWRIGQVGGGAAGLIAADLLPWPMVFLGLGLLIGVGIVAVLLNPEPAKESSEDAAAIEREKAERLRARGMSPALAAAGAWAYVAVLSPILDFARRPGWVAVLSFILLYKFGDAVLAVMKVPFFLEIGFSKTEIAEIAKLFGVAATIGGGFLGGVVLARFGLMTGLLVCGVLMAVSNLVFVLQAWAGHDLGVLAFSIAVENVTTGMGTTAFVAYLSSLCNVAYTATQYALLTSLMAISRTTMSAGAGWLADQVSWPAFFVLTTLAAVPGLLLLVWMMRRYPPKSSP